MEDRKIKGEMDLTCSRAVAGQSCLASQVFNPYSEQSLVVASWAGSDLGQGSSLQLI